MANSISISASVDGAADVTRTFENLKESAGRPAKWVVGTDVEYAVYLEQGTSRMPPYPFLRPAVEYVMRNEADAIAAQSETVDDLIGGLAMAIEKRAKHYATSGVAPGPDVQTGTLKASIRAERVQ